MLRDLPPGRHNSAAMLYVVRHRAATGQEPDAPLTDDGRRDAVVLAERLAGELAGAVGVRIVSGPCRRALGAIEPLATRLGLTVRVDDRLRERVLSTTPRPDRCELLRASFDDPDLHPDGGESSREAPARGDAAREEALRAGADATVVVTHGDLLTLLLRHVDGRAGFETWQGLENPDLVRIPIDGRAGAGP